MNWRNKRILAIFGLRSVLGAVVLLESLQVVLSNSTAAHLARMGSPLWVRLVLGGSEIVAALLFLVPVTALVGSYLLLVIFSFAMLIHFLHGESAVGGLLVYLMAVIVCIASREPPSGAVTA